MKLFQTLVTGMSALALVVAFAVPTLAAKIVISDEELDEVTAAGQPKIAQASSVSGSATSTNFQVNIFANEIAGQKNLTALTLNNIFGENQIANGVNIQSGADNSGDQSNSVLQSWGSAKAYDAVVVEAQPGGPGGNIGSCTGLIAKCQAGDGGDATPGEIGLLWAFGDEISEASSVSGPAKSTNIVVTVIATSFDKMAQSNLTALTVNNIVGFNQVANGVNISSGAIGGSGVAAAGTGSATNQSNSVSQWRGAPAGWNQAKTFF